MAKKRKISVRKLLRAFVTLVVTCSSVVLILGASRQQQTKTLNKVHLKVRNENDYLFLDKKQLWEDLVVNKGIKEGKTKLTALDIKSVERTSYQNQWISESQVYVDNKRDLHIFVTQRLPVSRVFYENGQSFYLDSSLRLLPLSDQFTYYTTIVTNVPVLKTDSANKALRAQIVKLVKFIEKDTFWNAQIAQISVTPEQKFELIPVLGTHKIEFGDTTNMQKKFNNLFAFYKRVLNKIGWDRYGTLDVKYNGLVVASPSIPWKPPTRNAISNMDWVKSIMGDAPKDSGAAVMQAAVKLATVATPPKPVVTPDVKTVVASTLKVTTPAPKPIAQNATTKKPETKVLQAKAAVPKTAPKKIATKPIAKPVAKTITKTTTKPIAAKKEPQKNTKPKEQTSAPKAKYLYEGREKH